MARQFDAIPCIQDSGICRQIRRCRFLYAAMNLVHRFVFTGVGLLGFVTFPFLARTRPIAYTAILILTAIIAPTPHPLTLVALAVPTIALYEGCIWVVWFIERRRPSGGPGTVAHLLCMWAVWFLHRRRSEAEALQAAS